MILDGKPLSKRIFLKRGGKHSAPLFYFSCLSISSLPISALFFFLFITVKICFFSLANPVAAESFAQETSQVLKQKADRLVRQGGYIVTKNNTAVAELNPNQPFIPASIFKIITASAALKILGPAFRFRTEFYQNDEGDLYIAGQGDPFLTSEEIDLIVDELALKNLAPIRDIIIDNSAFELNRHTEGSSQSNNPYDAINLAVVVNFNTFKINLQNNGDFESAEEQTPRLPIMQKYIAGLIPGKHRIAISSDRRDSVTYTCQLIRNMALQKLSFRDGKNQIREDKVPAQLQAKHIHISSRSLTEIIEALMLYSNNFIANQLYLYCGMHKYGRPATWEKGQKAISDFLEENHIESHSYKIIEGSGLSRLNMISPSSMIKVLNIFKPYSRLLPMDNGRFIKSGTLKGVYSYAGFFKKNDSLDPFVLILNQPQNSRDKVISILEKIWNEEQK